MSQEIGKNNGPYRINSSAPDLSSNTSCCECLAPNMQRSTYPGPNFKACECECHTAHQSSCEHEKKPRECEVAGCDNRIEHWEESHCDGCKSPPNWNCSCSCHQSSQSKGETFHVGGGGAHVASELEFEGESWEAEFDAQFPEIGYPRGTRNDRMKAFISKLLSERDEKLNSNYFFVESMEHFRAEGFAAGAEAERARLKKVAQEYKDKGFELETFIYSRFLDDDEPPHQTTE